MIVDNVPYALAPSATALIIGTQTMALRQATAEDVATIKDIIYTADSLSRLVIGSQTLIPDGPLGTVDNKPYYLALSFATATSNKPQNPPIRTPAGKFYKPGPLSNNVIEDKTLGAGGSPIILSDIIYSLAPDATALISKGITTPLSPPARVPNTIINIGGIPYTKEPASNYFPVGSQTLVPGGNPIYINRTPYALVSVPQGQEALVIGSVASFLVPIATAISTKQLLIIITLGFSIYTANAESPGIVIGSQTLVPGGKAIT